MIRYNAMIDLLTSKPVGYTLNAMIAIGQIAIFGSLAALLTVGGVQEIVNPTVDCRSHFMACADTRL